LFSGEFFIHVGITVIETCISVYVLYCYIHTDTYALHVQLCVSLSINVPLCMVCIIRRQNVISWVCNRVAASNTIFVWKVIITIHIWHNLYNFNSLSNCLKLITEAGVEHRSWLPRHNLNLNVKLIVSV
jgi:hypothetical protein